MPKSFIILVIGLNVIKRFLGILYVTIRIYPQGYDCGYTNSGINHAKKFDNNGHWPQCYKTLSWYNVCQYRHFPSRGYTNSGMNYAKKFCNIGQWVSML